MASALILFTLTLFATVLATPVPALVQHALGGDEKRNILGYIPSVGWTLVFVSIYGVITASLTWRYIRMRAKYMLAMVISLYFFSGGLALRFKFRSDPYSMNLYIVLNTLTILSPCGFIASVYPILGNMGSRIGGEEYMLINPRRVTWIFVLSDVLTFLVQGAGGGLVTQPKSAKLGQKVLLIGLILQLVSFMLFTLMFVRWAWLVRTREPATWNRETWESWKNDWRTLAAALAISCLGIIIRCLYRVIELSEGFDGHLATTEWYFFMFDALPLAFATGIFIPFWPARFFHLENASYNVPLVSTNSRYPRK